ncbi:thiol:disulfide interchange protein DsbA/DsbL [Providencia sp. Me31A]|uniref:thiol:disulfide interchange protein DsbA/DsbL n=1 Tax=Providencia sp. Me31A TaxID=3392637 RepID=UPI003D2D39B5
MNIRFKPITFTFYTLFVILVSSLMTVLFYHIFIFNTFSNDDAQDASFIEFSAEQVSLSPIKENNSIIEIFSYGCHYCAVVNDNISQFEKTLPENSSFKAIHLNMNNGAGLSAYAPIFATLDEMGIEPQLRKDLYKAVINDKLDLANEKVLSNWLKQQGIDLTEYLKASKSQAVQEHLEYMAKIADYYKIIGTPAFIINKRYVVYQDRDFSEFTTYMRELLNESNKEPQ